MHWFDSVSTVVSCVVLGTAFALLAYAVVLSLRMRADIRRFLRTPPPKFEGKPTPCPACGGTEHDYKAQGWDTYRDEQTGSRRREFFSFAVCRECGARWMWYGDVSPRLAPEDTWDQYVTSRPDPEYEWARGHDPLLEPVEWRRRSPRGRGDQP